MRGMGQHRDGEVQSQGGRKGPVIETGQSCSGHDGWNREQELNTSDR